MSEKEIVKTFFEWRILEKLKHNGWQMIGVDNLHSIAEHSLKAAQIGYVLAIMEGYEKPEEIATMLIFHDIGEIRTGDLNYITRQYTKKYEENAVKDQIENLPKKEKINDLWTRFEHETDTAGIIANDADHLEQALYSRELVLQGHKDAQLWIDVYKDKVKTESAKKLIEEINKADPNAWWQDIVLKKQ